MFTRGRQHLVSIYAIFFLFLLPDPSGAQSPAVGIISGIVIDAETGTPLPGANVSIQATSVMTATGRDGRFQLVAVPAGTQTFVVTYLGHEATESAVAVVAGQVLAVEVVAVTQSDDTDGLESTSRLLPGFPRGFIVMMNSEPRTFQIYRWEDIAAAFEQRLDRR
jgi:hypothetical protein